MSYNRYHSGCRHDNRHDYVCVKLYLKGESNMKTCKDCAYFGRNDWYPHECPKIKVEVCPNDTYNCNYFEGKDKNNERVPEKS